jgi:hypothetical protein
VIKIPNHGGVNLFYNIRTKTPESTVWTENHSIVAYNNAVLKYGVDSLVPQSDSAYTIVTKEVTSTQTLFQVQVLVGHYCEYYSTNLLPGTHFTVIAVDAYSDWSDTQTLTVNNISINTPTMPTTTDEATTETNQAFPPYTLPAAIVTIVIGIVVCFLVYGLRKQKPS